MRYGGPKSSDPALKSRPLVPEVPISPRPAAPNHLSLRPIAQKHHNNTYKWLNPVWVYFAASLLKRQSKLLS